MTPCVRFSKAVKVHAMDEDIREHIAALRTWIAKKTEIRIPAVGLSGVEKQQLQKINRAVEDLKRLHVPVPDDLLKLKLDLVTKDHRNSSEDINACRLAVDELVQSLQELLKTARQLRDRLNDRGIQQGTKKHYDVSLMDLIKRGYLSTADKFELQWLKDGEIYEGKLSPDGGILVKTNAGWKEYKSISTAASDTSGRSLNGWKHWCIVNHDGSRTPLIDIRAKYLKSEDVVL